MGEILMGDVWVPCPYGVVGRLDEEPDRAQE